MYLRILLFALLIPAFLPAQPLVDAKSESWIDSPEAYFATARERSEWVDMTDAQKRDTFKDRYWIRRDPTPGTAENEFRTTVLERIRVADQRFTNNDITGSRTDQGFVFVVFGTPARTGELRQAPLPAPNSGGGTSPAGGRGALGWYEGNEVTTTWKWERDRTPKLLDAIRLPSLEFTFVTEPNKRSVTLQNPGLARDLRDRLAEASIVNIEEIRPGLPTGAAIPLIELAPLATLPGPLAEVLKSPSRQIRHENGATFGQAVVLEPEGARTIVWAWVPEEMANERIKLVGLASTPESELGQFEAPFGTHPSFLASSPGRVAVARLPLAEGMWNVALAVVDGNEPKASSSLVVRVPTPGQAWAPSSLLLSGGIQEAAGSPDDFTLGGIRVLPRADATFLSSESLWYFFEVSNPVQPSDATVEVRLRRDGQPHGAPAVIPADLQQIAPGIWIAGYEMPLGTLPQGEYSLYLGVKPKTPTDSPILLRGDFRILAR